MSSLGLPPVVVSKLFGLKENVILGRKIPVGTGYGASNALDEGDEPAVVEEYHNDQIFRAEG